MACPDEFTLAMYADRETAEKETRQLRDHLAVCAQCRDLVAALEAENRALVHAFQELDIVNAQDTPREHLETSSVAGVTAAQLAAMLAGLALTIRAAMDYVTGIAFPVNLEWLSLFRMAGQLNFLLNSIVYLIRDGDSIFVSTVNNAGLVSFIAFAALFLAGALKLVRRSASVGVLMGTIIVVTAFSSPSYAIDVRKSQTGTVVINADE